MGSKNCNSDRAEDTVSVSGQSIVYTSSPGRMCYTLESDFPRSSLLRVPEQESLNHAFSPFFFFFLLLTTYCS